MVTPTNRLNDLALLRRQAWVPATALACILSGCGIGTIRGDGDLDGGRGDPTSGDPVIGDGSGWGDRAHGDRMIGGDGPGVGDPTTGPGDPDPGVIAGATYCPGAAPSGGPVYYLDAVDGDDDTGLGTAALAWQSLAKALSEATSGAVFYLRSGDYGAFQETSAAGRTDWITFAADVGATPVMSGIALNYGTATDAWLRFDGIRVEFTSGNGVSLDGARYVELVRSTVIGVDKYLVETGVNVWRSSELCFGHNHLVRMQRATSFSQSSFVTLSHNQIHELSGGTGVHYAGGNEQFVIEHNSFFDSNWSPSDANCPPNYDPHGSGVSIRSNDVVIRSNVFHSLGSSSGIMFYMPDAAGGEAAYSNITIENNLLYDIHNASILRMYNLGADVLVRNNTIIGDIREDTSEGTYRLRTAFMVHSLGSGSDGSGLAVNNNIFAGTATVPSAAAVRSNIFWAFSYQSSPHSFLCDLPGTSSTIVTCSSASPLDFFTVDFFAETPNLTGNHGQTLDYHLAGGSVAADYGDPALQTSAGLGTLDGGFLQDDGVPRDADHHSAGCYEP
jgi:hypothetical protein